MLVNTRNSFACENEIQSHTVKFSVWDPLVWEPTDTIKCDYSALSLQVRKKYKEEKYRNLIGNKNYGKKLSWCK